MRYDLLTSEVFPRLKRRAIGIRMMTSKRYLTARGTSERYCLLSTFSKGAVKDRKLFAALLRVCRADLRYALEQELQRQALERCLIGCRR